MTDRPTDICLLLFGPDGGKIGQKGGAAVNKKFHTLNGQGLCIHKEVRYGWRRVKQNGCGLLAAYNALGILNRPMDFFEIRKHFHRFWKPRFRGTSAFELRRFFRKQ